MPDLPYQGAKRMKNSELDDTNTEPLLEKASGPNGIEISFQILQAYFNQVHLY